jgi:DNA invertase Pin-like site-specific DNA recombinase
VAIIGYIRLSHSGDDLRVQRTALSKLSCDEIFQDDASFRNGGTNKLEGLAAALERVQPGDALAVARLDRFGRSLSRTVATINELLNRSVGFISVAESIDTRGAGGAELVRLLKALSEVERGVAKKNGRTGLVTVNAGRGRPPVITPEKFKLAQSLIASGLTVREAAVRIEVSKTVLYDALRANASAANGRDGFMAEDNRSSETAG